MGENTVSGLSSIGRVGCTERMMKANGNESDASSGRFGLRMPDRVGVDVSGSGVFVSNIPADLIG